MEIAKLSPKSVSNSLVLSNGGTTSKQPSKKILSEEEYTEKLEKIVTRDFFPDLPKLKAQNEYLDAMGKGDIVRLQEIQLAYQLTESTRSHYSSLPECGATPLPFATPDVKGASSPARTEIEDDRSSVVTSSSTARADPSLDAFLSGTTSEDNASFQEVVRRGEVAHRQKHPWLYADERAESAKLEEALAGNAALEGGETQGLVTWKYKNRNALMYVPDGVEWSAPEKLERAVRREINHGSTRFSAAPHADAENREAIAEAAALQAKMREGRVGIDGKEIVPAPSPRVGGYGFVTTPIPDPGGDTPLMTWGEIEGTPFRLDGGDTPLRQDPGGQQFRMPRPTARERIAHSLADKAAAKKCMRKDAPGTKADSFGNFGPSTPSSDKLLGLSPAAQRLAYAKLGIQRGSDRALRATYSPLRTPPVTPGGAPDTPSPAPPLLLPPAPKRARAKDFF